MKLRLKYWRTRRALSIKELAAASGVSTSTIVDIEKTGNAPGRAKVTRKLATALGVELDDLIDLESLEGKSPLSDEAIAAVNASWEESKNQPDYSMEEVFADFEVEKVTV